MLDTMQHRSIYNHCVPYYQVHFMGSSSLVTPGPPSPRARRTSTVHQCLFGGRPWLAQHTKQTHSRRAHTAAHNHMVAERATTQEPHNNMNGNLFLSFFCERSGRHFVVFDFFAPLDGQFFLFFLGPHAPPNGILKEYLSNRCLVSRGVAPESPDVERLG